MLSFVRQAISANGGTPQSYRLIDAWRELVTAYGGTPTKYSLDGVMREAVVAVGGTPTQFTEMGLLRELLEALGETVTSYHKRTLYEQLAGAVASGGGALPAPALFWQSDSETLDPVIHWTEIIEGDIAEVTVWNDTDDELHGTEQNEVDSSEAIAGTVDFATIPTLEVGKTYSITGRYQRDGEWSPVSNTITNTMTDETAPVLSSPTASATSPTTATVGVTTNEAGGTLYHVVTTSATPPSAAQIIAGEDHTGTPVAAGRGGSQAVATTGAKTANITGLSNGTFYAYFVHVDGASNESNVAAAASFTIVAPVLSSPLGTKSGATSADIGVTTDNATGTLYYVVTTSSTAPSEAQVKAGQNSSGAAATYAGSQAVGSSGAKTAKASGLAINTTYYAHYMHESGSGTQSSVSSSSSFTTDATYVGPGDLSAAAHWVGLRAYTAAKAGTSNVVRLRRSSDNAESDFGTTANGHLDKAAIVSWAAGSQVYIRTLYDQAGTNHIGQATTALQPELILNGQNGLSVARFVRASSHSLTSTTNLSRTQPFTTSVVAKRTGSFTSFNGLGRDMGFDNTANEWYANTGTLVTWTATDSVMHACQIVFNGASSVARVDGVETSINPGSNNPNNSPNLGNNGGSATDGDFCERAIITSGGLDGTARANMGANQRAYWGI